MLKVLLLTTLFTAYTEYSDKRLLLLFADDAGNTALVKQQTILKADPKGLKDRDLEVRTYYKGRDARMFKKYHIQSPFTVILIGKDDGEKLRSTKPLTLKKLFDTIDAMPMRKSEMN